MDDSVTLGEARSWLRDRAAKGERCPCCRQNVKVYRRKLNAGMAAWLIRFMLATRYGEWRHFRATARGSGDWSILRFWGLIEKSEDEVGVWRVTKLGRDFASRRVLVLSHAVIYDNQCLRLDGDPITVVNALGRKFDYQELMRERPYSNQPS
jgi:hypothetical protein